MAPERDEPELTSEFAKDAEDEAFLESLNRHLVPFEEMQLPVDGPSYPSVYVFGAPRSGTTLFTQVLAYSLDIGYVDHLIAAFWKAPVTGVKLSNKLFRGAPDSSFMSKFGRTSGVREPHEFGYFWSELLGYRTPFPKTRVEAANVDWSEVARVLSSITGAFGKPVLYKAYYAGWHIKEIASRRPGDVFVLISRDPVENALSILAMRDEYSGSRLEWPGLRPPEYAWLKDASPPVQAAGQVYFLERSFRNTAAEAPGANFVQVSYEKFCLDPMRHVLDTRRLMERSAEIEVVLRNEPPPRFEIGRRPGHENVRKEIAEALVEWQTTLNE